MKTTITGNPVLAAKLAAKDGLGRKDHWASHGAMPRFDDVLSNMVERAGQVRGPKVEVARGAEPIAKSDPKSDDVARPKPVRRIDAVLDDGGPRNAGALPPQPVQDGASPVAQGFAPATPPEAFPAATAPAAPPASQVGVEPRSENLQPAYMREVPHTLRGEAPTRRLEDLRAPRQEGPATSPRQFAAARQETSSTLSWPSSSPRSEAPSTSPPQSASPPSETPSASPRQGLVPPAEPQNLPHPVLQGDPEQAVRSAPPRVAKSEDAPPTPARPVFRVPPSESSPTPPFSAPLVSRVGIEGAPRESAPPAPSGPAAFPAAHTRRIVPEPGAQVQAAPMQDRRASASRRVDEPQTRSAPRSEIESRPAPAIRPAGPSTAIEAAIAPKAPVAAEPPLAQPIVLPREPRLEKSTEFAPGVRPERPTAFKPELRPEQPRTFHAEPHPERPATPPTDARLAQSASLQTASRLEPAALLSPPIGREPIATPTALRESAPQAKPITAAFSEATPSIDSLKSIAVIHREKHFQPVAPPRESHSQPAESLLQPARPSADSARSVIDRPVMPPVAERVADDHGPSPAPRVEPPARSITPSPAAPPPLQQIAIAITQEIGGAAPPALDSPVMQPAVRVSVGHDPLRTLNVALDPPELGRVTVKLRLTGRSLEVAVGAERAETASLLERDRHLLSKVLSASGYEAEDIKIQAQVAAVAAAPPNGRAAEPQGGNPMTPQFQSQGSAEGERQQSRQTHDAHDGRGRPQRETQGEEADSDPRRGRDLYV